MGHRGNAGTSSPEQPILFPPFRLLPIQQQLWRDEELVPLRPKALTILECLLGRPGKLFPRDELLALVWGDVRLSDGVLKTQIAEIRQALGDSARNPRFIETQHRRGYRFIGRVEREPADPACSFTAEIRDGARRDEPRVTPHFVGRSAELEALERCWGEALAGERQVVFVTGETGIGKTTLVNAFLQRALDSTGTCLVSWGQCIDQSGDGEPFLPVVEAARRLCARPDGEPVADCLSLHAPSWRAVLPNLPADSGSVGPPSLAAPARMLREMAEALEALSEQRAVCLVLEDVHWADHSTLDLLAYLAQRTGPARLLVLATYRPREALAGRLGEISDTLVARSSSLELSVPSLSEGEVGAYLTRRLAGHRLPHAVRELAHRRTEGNPLFLVSLVDHWLQRGFVKAAPGGYELVASVGELSRLVPPNVARMVERELERLNSFEQRVLEVASLARSEFSTAAIAATLNADLARVEETCLRWARAGRFLRGVGKAESDDGTETECYEFLHVLYAEHAYARLGAVRQGLLRAAATRVPDFEVARTLLSQLDEQDLTAA